MVQLSCGEAELSIAPFGAGSCGSFRAGESTAEPVERVQFSGGLSRHILTRRKLLDPVFHVPSADWTQPTGSPVFGDCQKERQRAEEEN